MTTTRSYDSTVARIAGNIASGIAAGFDSTLRRDDRIYQIARFSVDLAREIVDQTKRTEPRPPGATGSPV